jgi:Transposase
LFHYVKALRAGGISVARIKDKTGIGRQTLIKWIDSDDLPARRHPKPTPRSPAYFREFLEQQWAVGNRRGRHLLHDPRNRGCTGSHSHLARVLAKWRHPDRPTSAKNDPRSVPTVLVEESGAIDPVTGWQISPQVAAGPLPRADRHVDAAARTEGHGVETILAGFRRHASPGDAVSRPAQKRESRKVGGVASGCENSAIPSLQQFVGTLRRDLATVRNAIALPWSNGQAEGQINRPKTLKRAMYGRAGIELLRIRSWTCFARSRGRGACAPIFMKYGAAASSANSVRLSHLRNG